MLITKACISLALTTFYRHAIQKATDPIFTAVRLYSDTYRYIYRIREIYAIVLAHPPQSSPTNMPAWLISYNLPCGCCCCFGWKEVLGRRPGDGYGCHTERQRNGKWSVILPTFCDNVKVKFYEIFYYFNMYLRILTIHTY